MTPSPLGPLLSVLLSFALVAPISPPEQSPAQATVPRDAQAVAILQQAITAMGTVPSDSTATGTVAITEGSTSQTGTIQVLTLGTNATSETITLPTDQRIVVYSNGDAKETSGGQSANPTLQLIVTDQCADFPLPFLSSLLANADESLHYVGQETLGGESVQHLQTWNTFASKPAILQPLSPFSTRDLWFDSTSGLLVKMAYTRRAGGGAVPGAPVTISYGNYQNVSGVLYPFQINKSFNGTPWQTITIQNVSLNTGLTSAQFQTE
jgi:hypothetical protein